MSLLRFYINGQLLNQPPIEWRDTRIIVNWDNAIATPELSELEYTFCGDGYEALLKAYESGGIFKVPQVKIEITDGWTGSVMGVFDGYIDIRSKFIIDYENSRIITQIKKHNVTQSFDVMLDGITFGYVNSIGKAPKPEQYKEFKISVEKKLSDAEIASTFVLEGMTYFAIANVVKSAIDTAATIVGLLATGGLGSIAASAVYAAVCGVLELLYDAYVIYTLYDTIERLNETLKIKQFKTLGVSAYDGLAAICDTLGLQFETDIDDLKYTYYIPSAIKLYDFNMFGLNAKVQEKTDGLPNEFDNGYNCKDFFKMFADMFGAKYSLINGKLVFYNSTSEKWIERSTYRMPSVLEPQKTINANECFNTYIVKYITDSNNYHSVGFWRGTNAARETAMSDGTLNQKGIIKHAVLGLKEVQINASLATTVPNDVYIATSYNIIRRLIDSIFAGALSLGDKFVSALQDGGDNRADGSGVFNDKEDLQAENNESQLLEDEAINDFKIVVSDQFYSVPQLVYCKNGQMSYKHDVPISAKNLLTNYHKGSSFVQKDGNGKAFGQYETVENVKVPFGFDQFKALLECNHFTDLEGKTCIAKYEKWYPSQDYAELSYMIRDTYANNLIEKTYEPKGDSDIY